MPRGKKKEAALSPEERLQAALVPESEQPYKVPENWCWVRLGSLGYTNIGLTYKPSDKSETGTIVLRSSNIQDGKIDYSDIVRVNINIPENKMSQKGDILICARNGSKALVGKTALIDKDGMSYGAFMAIFRSQYNKIIFCYLNSPYFRDIIDRDVGTSTINQVTQNLIKELPFPLPPLFEQQRIVERIESLFAKLDEAKQKAQDALDSFETRKAAILHRAFTGELTARWRKEHGVGMEGWKKTALKDVCEKIVCGKTPTGFIQPTGEIPYLKVYNIVDNKIDFESMPQFIPKELHEGKLKSSILKPCDVIMNIVGPPLRKIAIIPDNYPEWNMNQAIVRFRPYNSLQYRFLYYALVNPETLDEVIAATKGVVGQANISVTQSRELVISLPSTDEQIEIVRVLDDLLAKEQQAKEAAEKVLEQIDLTKKAILARAFRGELGTNDPSEENAVVLIENIITHREDQNAY